MKQHWIVLAAAALMLVSAPAWTDTQTETEAPAAATEAEYARVAEEAEAARAEAEKARAEAARVAERAREVARARASEARERAELSAERAEARDRERAVREAEMERAREAEMERAREELSRAHRELREAQRDVARAHRELARPERAVRAYTLPNLGDRPVIGVVMGEETAQGVELVGVSPDGPAEAAGIEVGDVMVAINGTRLATASGGGKPQVFEVMEAAKAGDTIQIDVERDGDPMSFEVVAEVREPASWQSIVRIPEITTVERIEPGPDGERRIVIESHIDEEAIAERMEILKKRLEDSEHALHAERWPHLAGEYEYHLEDYSDLAGEAFASANVWFGLPQTQGLAFAAINEGLGPYFKTDRGVLVLKAKDDNAYQLEAGDVILKVGETEVDTPSDLMRALREIEPGEEIEIAVKRDRRNKTLNVTMPENRFGFRWPG